MKSVFESGLRSGKRMSLAEIAASKSNGTKDAETESKKPDQHLKPPVPPPGERP